MTVVPGLTVRVAGVKAKFLMVIAPAPAEGDGVVAAGVVVAGPGLEVQPALIHIRISMRVHEDQNITLEQEVIVAP